MKKTYEAPEIEVLKFDYNDVITASNGLPVTQITKNPGHHYNCTVMPNGKPIPENAVGYWGNHDEP